MIQRTIGKRLFGSSIAPRKPSGLFAAVASTVPLAVCTGVAAYAPEVTWMALEVQSVAATALLGLAGGVHVGIVAGAKTTALVRNEKEKEESLSGTGALFGVSPAVNNSNKSKTQIGGGATSVFLSSFPVLAAISSAVLFNVPGALVANAAALNLLLVAETASSSVPRWVVKVRALSTLLATGSIAGGLYLGYEHDRKKEEEDEGER
ncbi:UNVERIFIED_CONTAM: hypothetical protein HDU68_011444 [Siphonaria sp. JEL0065]|nr:hypothetical protein HDU68_011444 [Siphonaria sp. JEL0065]